MTYYLKYRPQLVEDLDLTAVREQLKKVLAATDKPHAFLFAGPRGAGKTSTARILAKAVNCENPAKDGEPCNKCSGCISITRGNSLDVVEIDAASHRGIEDIRSLRETIKLAPSSSKMKIYIIDEAHMLTTEAANALLKTLEEPPAHAMFILATTAPDKLLDTIRSRCFLVNFNKGTSQEVIRALKRTQAGEKLKIEDGVLEFLAGSVDGSFREAHKLLEQLALVPEKITLGEAKKLYFASSQSPDRLVKALEEKDAKGALEEIGDIVKAGVNLKVYTTELVRQLRGMLLVKMGIEGGGETKLSAQELHRLIEIFSEASSRLATALIPQLPLELGVVKWVVSVEQSQSARLVPYSPSQERNSSASSRSRGLADGELSTLDSASQNLVQTREQGARGLSPAPAVGGSKEERKEEVGVNTLDEGELEEKWREIVKVAKSKNFAMEALLRAARPQTFDGKILQIEIFYRFHKEKLEKEPLHQILEDVVKEVLGANPVRLVYVLSSTKKRVADIENVAPATEEDIARLAEEIFTGSADGKVH